jgi:uncharacterized protein YbjT (DUF2867 family)
MSKRIYTILGATGHIGQVITEELLKKGHTVMALGRDPKKLTHLKEKGAHIMTPAFNDTTALTEAFKGADGIFTMIPPSYSAVDFGEYQNETGEAIAQSLKDSGVKNHLFLSSIGADKPSGTGPIANLYKQEKRLEMIAGLNNLFLRPAYFMENIFWALPVIKGMGVYGTPLRADLPIPMVATHDIGVKAAELLDKLDFTGNEVFELGGPKAHTLKEVASLVGKAIGKPDLAYVQFPYEDAKKGMMGSGMNARMADLMIEMNKAFNEGLVMPTQSLTGDHQGHFPLEEFVKFAAGAYSQS